MSEVRTVDLLKDGVPVLTGVDRDLLKVTTIKKKFVDQMPVLNYGDFCAACKEDRAGFVGRVSDKHVVVKTLTGFSTVTPRDWVEWRQHSRYFDDLKDNKMTVAQVSKIVRAEFLALPQLFVE
jgi:hypothetical protein